MNLIVHGQAIRVVSAPTSPTDYFRCEQLDCTLRAGICVARQKAVLGGSGGKQFSWCATGQCPQGKRVLAKMPDFDIGPTSLRAKMRRCKLPGCTRDFLPKSPLQVYCQSGCADKAERARRKAAGLVSLRAYARVCAVATCRRQFRTNNTRQATCSRACSNAYRSTGLRAAASERAPKKSCLREECQKPILPNVESTGRVNYQSVRRARFCCQRCAALWRWEQKRAEGKSA